jgi:hypothetical protein
MDTPVTLWKRHAGEQKPSWVEKMALRHSDVPFSWTIWSPPRRLFSRKRGRLRSSEMRRLARVRRGELTPSRQQLIFHYKVKFESIRFARHNSSASAAAQSDV